MNSNGTSTDDGTSLSGPTRPVVVAAIFGGVFVLLSMLALSTSFALFTDNEAIAANSFTTASLDLVDDDTSTAMFNVSGLYPGQTVERCIVVTHQGSVATPGPVRLFTTGYTDSSGGDLGDHLYLTVQEGSGGSFAAGDCTGFSSNSTIVPGLNLEDFAAARTNYATGVDGWTPTGTPETRTFRFAFQLNAAAPSNLQGQSISALNFTWEVQT